MSDAFASLVGGTALDLQSTPDCSAPSSLATRTSAADSVRIKVFEICDLGDVDPSGAPDVDFDSLVTRFPVTISSLTASADVEAGDPASPDTCFSRSQVCIRFAPLRVDVLGRIGVDGISGRVYIILYGIDIVSMWFSSAEMTDTGGTEQIARLHQILSDPFVHRAMQSTVGLLAHSGVERDQINAEINRSLRRTWPDPPTLRDALDMAADFPAKISLTTLSRVAARSMMSDYFAPVGAPEIDEGPGNWNTRVSQCFAAARADGGVEQKRVSMAFRVHEGGQVTTTVST